LPNLRIEKIKIEIEKTENKIADYTSKITELTRKLKEFKQMKIDLENEEIIALFRRERLTEDEFTALLRSQREKINTDDISDNELEDNFYDEE